MSCLSSFNTAPMVKFVILAARLVVLVQLATSRHSQNEANAIANSEMDPKRR